MGLESPFTTSLHKRHVAAEDLSIPEQSPRNKETDKKINKSKHAICRKYGTALTRDLHCAIPMISRDFLTRWNVITGERGGEVREKKDNFELFHIFG